MEYKNGITVVVPVYNAENSLKYCVNSIINQVYKDWYLVLVDDGSTDSSPQICDEYAEKHPNIRVIHKQNGGVSSARNTGINVTDTEYLVFVDSDDYVSSDYLQSLFDVKNMYPNIGHVWNTFQTVKDYSSIQSVNLDRTSHEIKIYNRSDLMDLISLWYVQGPVCKLFKTSIIKQNSIYMDESKSLGEDLLFNLAYLDCEPNNTIAVNDNKSYCYFISDNSSLDHKYRSDFLDIMLHLQKEMYNYLIDWNVGDEEFQKYYNNYLVAFYRIFDNTFHEDNNASFISKIKYNSSILKSEQFRLVLNKSDCYVNPLVNFGFHKGKYFIVYLTQQLAKIKNRRK